MDGGGAFGCGAADNDTMEFAMSNKSGRRRAVNWKCIVLEIF
jgi:hypothetical protein